MSIGLLNIIANAFYEVVGGNIMLPLMIVLFIILLLFTIKAGKVAFVIIIVPLVTVLFSVGLSKFFEGVGLNTQWILITGWLLAGFIVAGLFWKIMQ